MRALPDPCVFDRSEARAAGWSDSALTRAVRSGRLIVVRRGLFAAPGPTSERLAVLAAVRAVAGSAVSHRSALALHGLPVVGRHPAYPELTVRPSGTGDAHRTLLHRAALAPADLTRVDGVQVTSVARTVVDVARSRPAIAAVPAMDAALNRQLITHDDLDDVLVRCWNWPGIGRAQRTLRLVDGRAESALESVSRLVIGRLRLPQPELQPIVLDQRGLPVARLDFYWEEFGVAGEADGRAKYDSRDVLTAEKDRQERVENLRLPFARWGWEHAWRRPQQLRTRLEEAFERGRTRDRSGLPRLWSISLAEPVGRGENVIRAGQPNACPRASAG